MPSPRFAEWLALGAALATLAASPRAHAQNPAAAEALFEQARAAMAEGSLDIACARFRDSDRLDPAVGTRFNLADCEERRGRVATAWSLFRGVIAELSSDDDRRPIARERAKALEARLPYLTLQRSDDAPRGVRLRIDGVELGEGSFGVALPMDPGRHELHVLVPGEAGPRVSSFSLKEGEHATLPIRTTAASLRVDGSAGETGSVAEDEAAVPRDDSRATWGYVAGGIGAAGMVLGTVAGIVTLNKKSTADANCSDALKVCNRAGVDANESGKTYAALSGISFAIGVLGLGAGAYLLLAEDGPSAAHVSIPSPRVVLAPGVGYVSLSGSF